MLSARELLKVSRERKKVGSSKKITFNGVEDFDVYNITAPFQFDGQKLIAGRVEKRENESSFVAFFKEVNAFTYERIESATELQLQDPFVTFIDGKLILGGVETFPNPDDDTKLSWRTNFYVVHQLNEVELIFTGPNGMKDLRLKQLRNGEIIVLTRPQGDKGGRGKIGYLKIRSLGDLTIDKIESAPLLQGNFNDADWGGANEIYELENGEIAVLGHIAFFDEENNRHYYPLVFWLEDDTISRPKIIAERADFLDSPAKRADLIDVVFSGGLVLGPSKAILYAGISDASAQYLELDNPFKKVGI
ncbi:hypothetical protein X560_2146 [Listeria fleischmannii 1991]|uniref:Protein of uncharacterized function (DUF1861) n=2 Tax=Listeria fleischmannii TaxID=1069827 RepID=A0A2X3H1J1_9LIST|nr:DUF1861 family protein [Listeria fleischmannii]EMG27806.1 hypothetical protein LFLEISCH_08882 [Listeria fleischmannii subsp. fleischmannii LU2006-1]KMT58320.1 hypothetical protein X560_2146 [Listeria fleischmannii 1991]SQC66237.1 Protein of uncharacterised function (DUF1861) [Listeria fleischmannii subsp. fleischmannii]